MRGIKLKYHFSLKLLVLPLLLLMTESFGQVIDLGEFKEATPIGDRVFYFEDLTNELTYNDVLERKSDFIKIDRKVFGRPAAESVLWVYFEANSLSEDDIWLDIHNSNLLSCQLYKLDENGQLDTTFSTSSIVSYSDRMRAMHTFWFPLINGGDQSTYKFLIAVKSQLALELPLYVGPEYALHVNANDDNWMAFAFIGGMLGLFIYNIFFFFSLRRLIYLYYSLNVLAFLFVMPYFNNFPISNYLFGHDFTHIYISTWVWIPFLTSALFASRYLKLKRDAPRLRYFLMIYVSFFIILIPFVLKWQSTVLAQTYVIGTLIFYLSCTLIGFYMLLVKKQKKALLFSIGWTAMFISIIAIVLVRNGVIEHNLILRNASYIGIFVEMFVFAIAIGKFMNELRNDQIKLNKALIESNEELVALNESLDSFNYHVSHDLKTVLNNTKALSSMALKYNEKGDQDKLREIVLKMHKVAENGVETVQSFLSLGKIDHLFESEETQQLHLSEEIDALLNLHELKEKITVKIIEKEYSSLIMHSKAFESIFLNLFTNTVKYSTENPRAEIRFYRSKGLYFIAYQDFGIGIDMDKYGSDIFKPFNRAGHSEKFEGSGVGLYILNRIVSMYNGKCQIESKLGEGILLTICLPANMVSVE